MMMLGDALAIAANNVKAGAIPRSGPELISFGWIARSNVNMTASRAKELLFGTKFHTKGGVGDL